jgi:hypothetical protein
MKILCTALGIWCAAPTVAEMEAVRQHDFSAAIAAARSQEAPAYSKDGYALCAMIGNDGLNFLRIECGAYEADCWSAQIDRDGDCAKPPYPWWHFASARRGALAFVGK